MALGRVRILVITARVVAKDSPAGRPPAVRRRTARLKLSTDPPYGAALMVVVSVPV